MAYQAPHSPKVEGSNPSPATNKDKGSQANACEPFVRLVRYASAHVRRLEQFSLLLPRRQRRFSIRARQPGAMPLTVENPLAISNRRNLGSLKTRRQFSHVGPSIVPPSLGTFDKRVADDQGCCGTAACKLWAKQFSGVYTTRPRRSWSLGWVGGVTDSETGFPGEVFRLEMPPRHTRCSSMKGGFCQDAKQNLACSVKADQGFRDSERKSIAQAVLSLKPCRLMGRQ